MESIKTLARKAYKNRYAFGHVTIDKCGKMQGHWHDARQKLDPVELGNIADCCTRVNERKTGVLFYNRDFIVYTFAMDVLK